MRTFSYFELSHYGLRDLIIVQITQCGHPWMLWGSQGTQGRPRCSSNPKILLIRFIRYDSLKIKISLIDRLTYCFGKLLDEAKPCSVPQLPRNLYINKGNKPTYNLSVCQKIVKQLLLSTTNLPCSQKVSKSHWRVP